MAPAAPGRHTAVASHRARRQAGGMPLPPSIGIIGGMGPWVDPLLLGKLLRHQAALGMRRDQQAIPVVLAQFSPLFEDRTEYLAALAAGRPSENPAVAAARVARWLTSGGARVLGIPCNTFHAAPIFERFRQEIADLTDGPDAVQLVHMIHALLDAIKAQLPAARRVGVLSTTGTYLQRIYADALSRRSLEPVMLPYDPSPIPPERRAARKQAILGGGVPPEQQDVHEAITNPEWGIKSGRGAEEGYPEPKAVLKAAARRLAQSGAQALILGCTEIPLALAQADLPELPMLDPLDALARGLVDAWRARFNPAWPAATGPPSPPA